MHFPRFKEIKLSDFDIEIPDDINDDKITKDIKPEVNFYDILKKFNTELSSNKLINLNILEDNEDLISNEYINLKTSIIKFINKNIDNISKIIKLVNNNNESGKYFNILTLYSIYLYDIDMLNKLLEININLNKVIVKSNNIEDNVYTILAGGNITSENIDPLFNIIDILIENNILPYDKSNDIDESVNILYNIILVLFNSDDTIKDDLIYRFINKFNNTSSKIIKQCVLLLTNKHKEEINKLNKTFKLINFILSKKDKSIDIDSINKDQV